MTDYYGKSSSGIDYYTLGQSSNSEPDMRQEMIDTIDGAFPEISKGRYVILRQARRDTAGRVITCDCVDPVTKEPDRDTFCPLCMGISYYFDEVWIRTYKVLLDKTFSAVRRHNMIEPGIVDAPFVAFYFKYDAYITKEDRITEVRLNDDGSVYTPIQRIEQYKIDKAWDYRADYGKLEYWKVYAHKEELKYLATPAYSSENPVE